MTCLFRSVVPCTGESASWPHVHWVLTTVYAVKNTVTLLLLDDFLVPASGSLCINVKFSSPSVILLYYCFVFLFTWLCSCVFCHCGVTAPMLFVVNCPFRPPSLLLSVLCAVIVFRVICQMSSWKMENIEKWLFPTRWSWFTILHMWIIWTMVIMMISIHFWLWKNKIKLWCVFLKIWFLVFVTLLFIKARLLIN